MASDDLVSLKDIAARTGRTYESARLLASGKRGPGGFPPPVTTADGWSLYSWAQVAQWLRTNLLTETVVEPDHRILAAVDHLVRARCLLEDREHGLTTLADLLTPRGPRGQPGVTLPTIYRVESGYVRRAGQFGEFPRSNIMVRTEYVP